jgi:hypothetical protein
MFSSGWGVLVRCRGLQLAVVVSALLGLAACSETFDSTYATFSEAQREGATIRGWVPAWLPPNATNIREVHDIDTNRFMLGFTVAKRPKVTLPNDCVRIGPRAAAKPPFRRQWWPSDVPANPLATHRHSFFKCNDRFVDCNDRFSAEGDTGLTIACVRCALKTGSSGLLSRPRAMLDGFRW